MRIKPLQNYARLDSSLFEFVDSAASGRETLSSAKGESVSGTVASVVLFVLTKAPRPRPVTGAAGVRAVESRLACGSGVTLRAGVTGCVASAGQRFVAPIPIVAADVFSFSNRPLLTFVGVTTTAGGGLERRLRLYDVLSSVLSLVASAGGWPSDDSSLVVCGAGGVTFRSGSKIALFTAGTFAAGLAVIGWGCEAKSR